MLLEHAPLWEYEAVYKIIIQGSSCLMSLILFAAGKRAFSDDTQAFHAHHRLCNVLQSDCQREFCDGEIKRS